MQPTTETAIDSGWIKINDVSGIRKHLCSDLRPYQTQPILRGKRYALTFADGRKQESNGAVLRSLKSDPIVRAKLTDLHDRMRAGTGADRIVLEGRSFRHELGISRYFHRALAFRGEKFVSQWIYDEDQIFEDDVSQPPRFLVWLGNDENLDESLESMQKLTNIFVPPGYSSLEDGSFEGFLWVPVLYSRNIPPIFTALQAERHYPDAGDFLKSVYRRDFENIHYVQLPSLRGCFENTQLPDVTAQRIVNKFGLAARSHHQTRFRPGYFAGHSYD